MFCCNVSTKTLVLLKTRWDTWTTDPHNFHKSDSVGLKGHAWCLIIYL